MKKIINNIYLMCSIMLLIMLGACSDEDKFMGDNGEIVVTATMPDDGTSSNHGTLKSVAVSSDDNTLNLITKWKSGDKIQVFVRQDNKVYKVSEESAVYNISSDGKTCSFNFSLPSSIDGARVYDVIGVTGISAQASGSEVYATSTLKRMNLDSNGEATSPMWFITAKTNTATNFQAKFQHLGTYEILHVTNATSGDLTFRHLGFDVSEPWFKYNDNTALNNTYDPTASFTEPGDVESPPILIRAGKTGKILSWYMPSGSLMEGAKLLALINGKNVTSSNTKSSALPIQRGKAYHMYATWDGKQLKFDDNEHGAAEHEYVDLGLPSGTLWATMNMGASSPEDYGDYFAWGETTPKSVYDWSTYKWCNGSSDTMIKYCTNSSYGYNGFVDNKTELDPEDDAAYVNWGPGWRMPSYDQVRELINECDWQWTTRNGVAGHLVTSKHNGASLFLPATGYRDGNELSYVGSTGGYWSRTLCTIQYSYFAEALLIGSEYIDLESIMQERSHGRGIRAVRSNEDENIGLVENGDFTQGTEGFTSDYVYVSETGNYALFAEGKYAIGTSPSNYHYGFINHGDHTTGTGKMLIANGHPDNSKYVWKKYFNVEKGVTYEFSAWFLSVSGDTPLNRDQIEYNIDGASNLGAYDKSENGWDRYFWRYTATRTGNIEIKIRTKSSALGGNDFAIDDIYFSKLYSFDKR